MNLDGETNLKEKFLLTGNIPSKFGQEQKKITVHELTGFVFCD